MLPQYLQLLLELAVTFSLIEADSRLSGFFSTLTQEHARLIGFSTVCCGKLGADCEFLTFKTPLLIWHSLVHLDTGSLNALDLVLDENVLALCNLSGPGVYFSCESDPACRFSKSYLINFLRSVR